MAGAISLLPRIGHFVWLGIDGAAVGFSLVKAHKNRDACSTFIPR
jgi:hypothetical protein